MSERTHNGREPAVDADDIRLALGGDGEALERLYRRHLPPLYALCLRLTADPVAAEQLTQDTFVRAWQQLGRFRGAAALPTWLHRLAVNEMTQQRRSRRRHRERAWKWAGEQAVVTSGAGPEHRLDLERAIAALPEGARTVFVLYDIEGYSHREIARMLRIAVGTSKAHLHRARHLLREGLSR